MSASTSVSAVSNCNNYKASKSVVPFAGAALFLRPAAKSCRISAKETIFGNAHRFILFLTHFRAKMMQIFRDTRREGAFFVIEVSHLTKKYGSRLAVETCPFTVEDGVIYGLLGPNGAVSPPS